MVLYGLSWIWSLVDWCVVLVFMVLRESWEGGIILLDVAILRVLVVLRMPTWYIGLL